jgi:dolichyl-phosphate-mannose-protein mannosyltransferase
MARPSSARGKSPAPPADSRPNGKGKNTSYQSDGVKDNDVFLLPGSDYLILLLLTLAGAAVRIFRISQPTSVVFDEVQ